MAFDAQEFAKLMARFDTGNASEAEAMSAARMMRRMVASEGLRFVDVMERADVKKALDAQLQQSRYAAGDALTVADISLGASLVSADSAKMPLENYRAIARWRTELAALPGWKQAASLMKPA